MTQKNSPQQNKYIDVDSLQQQLITNGNPLEQIANFYNVDLPTLHKTQNETRMACIFTCQKTEPTGDRAISIKTKQDGAIFRCFQYGCTTRGNLLNLMFLLKHNHEPSNGKLKGTEFKEIANDLKSLINGEPPSEPSPQSNKQTHSTTTESTTTISSKKSHDEPETEPPLINIPLKDSENERARELTNLDTQFITNVAEMPPEAATYVRKRPFLTAETMKKHRCGYLPKNAKGLLRGHFVYAYPNENGDILTWFGRNLNYEPQHKKWHQTGTSKTEPRKFKFVKNFHRGQELYNEPQFQNLTTNEHFKQNPNTGITIVEGPNDAINLTNLGVPTLAICSNVITKKQTKKLASLANQLQTHITVMFDQDQAGQTGAKQTVLELAKHCCVRLAWHSETIAGKFKNRQPESISKQEWQEITAQVPISDSH